MFLIHKGKTKATKISMFYREKYLNKLQIWGVNTDKIQVQIVLFHCERYYFVNRINLFVLGIPFLHLILLFLLLVLRISLLSCEFLFFKFLNYEKYMVLFSLHLNMMNTRTY